MPGAAKIGQLTTWGLLGAGVLLSYFFLVRWARPNVSKLWYGTPKWIQYVAYGLWALAAIGAVAYAAIIPFAWPRLLLVSVLLVASMAWSYALIFQAPKLVTMSTLVIVAVACLSLVSYESVNGAPWYLVLCLLPLLLINVGLDAGLWNYMFYISKA